MLNKLYLKTPLYLTIIQEKTEIKYYLYQKNIISLREDNNMVTFEEFMELDIRVGEISRVEDFEKAHDPAYKLWVDFGDEIGIKKTSAQITECYDQKELIGKQVLGVVNFPDKQIADFMSEVLVLGIYADQGVVLIEPEQKVKKGDKLG